MYKTYKSSVIRKYGIYTNNSSRIVRTTNYKWPIGWLIKTQLGLYEAHHRINAQNP